MSSSGCGGPKSALLDEHGAVLTDRARGWLFDLDGVLVDTARLHRQAWTELFDELFSDLRCGRCSIEPFTPADYSNLVDGRTRMDGIRSVLRDRDIDLPEGHPDDPTDTRSVCGLANRKERRFSQLLAAEGPAAFPGAAPLLRRIRARRARVAVVSGSRHAERVLRSAGLTALVDARVDGEDAASLGLPGKPDPATLLEAARRLAVQPELAVVVEDARAGVAAARAGAFGLVIGISRGTDPAVLRAAGADLVIADIGDIAFAGG